MVSFRNCNVINSVILGDGSYYTKGSVVTGGESSPDVSPGGICLKTDNTSIAEVITFKNSDISHPFSGLSEVDTYGSFRRGSSDGGFIVRGFTETGTALQIQTFVVNQSTSDTGVGAGSYQAYRSDGGTGITTMSDSGLMFSFRNSSNTKVAIFGGGDVVLQGGLKLSSYVKTAAAGAIQWNGSNFQGYDGASWIDLDSSGGGTPGGSDSHIQYNNGGSFGGDSSFVWDDTNKRLGIGCSDPEYDIEVSKDAAESQIVSASFGTSSFPRIFVQRSRGTRASRSAVQSGDSLGQFAFRGQFGTGTNWFYGSYVESSATESWDASNRGADFRIYTTSNGSTSQSERFRVSDSGKLSTGGESSPDVDPGGICINHGSNDGKALSLKNSDISHSITLYHEADTYGYLQKLSGSNGGLIIGGLSEATNSSGVHIDAAVEAANSNSFGWGVINLNCCEHDGSTGVQVIGDSDVFVSFRNCNVINSTILGDGSYITKGDLEVASAKFMYWGDRNTDGSWRFGRFGNDMILQKRESGTWNTKHTFGE